MNRKFSERFSTQWVKVKFYAKEPRLNGVTYPARVTFCEAVRMAITQPVVVSKASLSCESAKYIFGWREKFDTELLSNCQEKCEMSNEALKSLVSDMPRLNGSFSCIGLNTDDCPDLVMSCLAPQEMMKIIKVYNSHSGKNVEVSLNSMMGLCGNIAARTFAEGNLNISFGCSDSRKFAEIGRDRLVVGIPQKLFKVFVERG